MTTTVVAQIRAIRTGHSERAQVHAVCARGRDYKIEVGTDEVPGIVGDMIVLSWTAHANPAVATSIVPTPDASAPAPVPAPAPTTGEAADVDNQFDALMRGAAARQALTPEQQLAALLGVPGAKAG